MGERCPFCWGQNIKHVGALPKDRPSGTNGHLLECQDCEKWYWARGGAEAAALFMHCGTSFLRPQRCYEEIREIVLSAGNGFPRRRLAEFNHLCAECPNGRFVPDRDFHSRPKNPLLSSI